jgi:hypothetical protein
MFIKPNIHTLTAGKVRGWGINVPLDAAIPDAATVEPCEVAVAMDMQSRRAEGVVVVHANFEAPFRWTDTDGSPCAWYVGAIQFNANEGVAA